MYMVLEQKEDKLTQRIYLLWSKLIMDVVVELDTYHILKEKGQWNNHDMSVLIFQEGIFTRVNGEWKCIWSS